MVGDHMGILGAVVFFPSSPLSPPGGPGGGCGREPARFFFYFPSRGGTLHTPRFPKSPKRSDDPAETRKALSPERRPPRPHWCRCGSAESRLCLLPSATEGIGTCAGHGGRDRD